MRTLILIATATLTANAMADTFSDFESGAEGWLGVNVAFPSLDVLNTWNPTWTGHSITATEEGSGLFVLAAPVKFRGNKLSYLGGTVSFQLSDTVADGVPYPSLLLRGNGTILFFETPAPGTSLTNYSIPLSAPGWKNGTGSQASQSELISVFSNLDVFAINADWRTGGTDSVELDSVRMSAPVPEPATLAALGLGVIALKRRRHRATQSR